ncbi:hypothetical protein BDN70DRAFT_998357 [Pholiota conissans]|uniref:Uncharacterized protein n=1 Tax=Pholiota conissans TaxID=109636 RepID=A0A9P6CSF0_9AGAR|nr:hypothetical protein BDN70DRAFT_998357 [Pholiota conissans]
MSSSSTTVVPAEVIDLIVDEISQIRDERTRNKALASVALVSWYCRHRAHARLFSNLYITETQRASGTLRIRSLLQLIEADKESEISGVASYIRSFSVHLVGPTSRIRASLDNGTLASILRRIFKTKDVGPRSLSLSFLPRGNLRNVFDWTTLNADFLSAFHDLCYNPSLTTLHLAHFVNLPRTLLHHSFIKNVRFSKVQLANTDDEDEIPEEARGESILDDPDISALEEGQAVPLESIDTDHSLPLLFLIDMTPQQILHPKLAFSQLRCLTAHINSIEDFHKTRWILINAASTLKKLDIILFTNDEMPETHWRVAFSQLAELKTISVMQNSTSYKHPGRTSIPQICSFMEHFTLHPNLEEVKISMFLYSHRDLTARTPEEIFDGHDLSPLDQLFSHARFYTLKRLSVEFKFNLYLPRGNWDIQAFRAASREHVGRSFALTSATHAALAINFKFDIHAIRYDHEQTNSFSSPLLNTTPV